MRVSALVLIDETRTSQTPDGAIARSWTVPRLLRSPSGEAGCSRTVGRQPHSLGRPGGEIPHIVYHLDQDIPIPAIPTTGVFRAHRVWTLLDQLLTAPTLLDAEQHSRELTSTEG